MTTQPLGKYLGSYEEGMILTLRGRPGLRRIHLLAKIEDVAPETWLFEDVEADMWGEAGPDPATHRVTEEALRVEFVPEES